MITEWINIADSTVSEGETEELLRLLWDAHVRASTQNNTNASNVAVMVAASGSGSLQHALASAILSTGGLHAPVTQARTVLFRTPIPAKAPEDTLVPGFGNSFFKDSIDPAWDALVSKLKEHPKVWRPIEAWQELIADSGRAVYPNAAAFTAAVAELVGWPDGLEPVLVIQPRISVWARVFRQTVPTRAMLS